jgi:dTDP-4-amino-4,6-dideoxygalactose transaminase
MIAMGERTDALEGGWASYSGVRNAVFMANGTVALEALLRSLGIGPGDEVVTVSFSFSATASAILQVGATPVFVDVSEDDFNMDPALLEAAITPRTVALVPVHLYGLMADMDPIVAIAKRHGLALIEDAAQAIGATYGGRSAGQFGHAVFSLYATKSVAAGEGGMVTTEDDALADRLRRYRNHGQSGRYDHSDLGTNLRPTDISAAIGLVQLGKLPENLDKRRRNAERLSEGLAGFRVPVAPIGRDHAWHQYTVRFAEGRDRVAAHLHERGIGTAIHYPTPIHRQPYIGARLANASAVRLPVTDLLAGEVLSLPVRPNLTEDELEAVIDGVNAAAATPVR